MEDAKKEIVEGMDRGKQSDEQGCLTEAISRYKQHRGLGGSISTGVFLRGCLETARPTPGFCDQVPDQRDIFGSARWQMKQCQDAGLSDSFCGQIFGQVQEHCKSRRTKPNPEDLKPPPPPASPNERSTLKDTGVKALPITAEFRRGLRAAPRSVSQSRRRPSRSFHSSERS